MQTIEQVSSEFKKLESLSLTNAKEAVRQASLLQNQHHDFVKNNKNSVFELAVGMYRDGMD